MVVLYAARHRVPVPSLARWLLGAGIAATLTANMAHGWSHGLVGAVVAAWPAVSLVGSYELSLGVSSLLHDVALKRSTESFFCNTCAMFGARRRRCSEACPPRTCNMCNTLDCRRRRTYPAATCTFRRVAQDALFAPRRMSSWSGSSAHPGQQNTGRWPGTATTPRPGALHRVLPPPQPLPPSSPAGASATRQTRHGRLRLRSPGRRPSPPAGSVTRRYLKPSPSMTRRWPCTG